MKNILEMLESNAEKNGAKVIFSDNTVSETYQDFTYHSQKIGSFIADRGIYAKSIAVFVNKSVGCLQAMFGVLYSGNHYLVIDTSMPAERISSIFEKAEPAAVICAEDTYDTFMQFGFEIDIINLENALNYDKKDDLLLNIRKKQIDTDPAYIIFTSGSTGKPKGTIVSHRSVLTYIEWFCSAFDIGSDTVFGNQTPFYFSMSVSDVFACVRSGATLHILPKTYFSFPVKLFEYMRERGVNTIYWVPSALCIVANWKTFDVCSADFLKKILFAGEVMPTKQLNYWRSNLPQAVFANLFGPTETTDICSYYILNRELSDDESVPIGNSCDNCECLIIDEDSQRSDSGELYVRGSFVALGYINDGEKNNAAFVQNPLNKAYPEIVYKTGDIVKLNEYGEMEFVSRKDSQIKHFGYRIELGEIESAANKIEGINLAVVVYNKQTDDIIMAYQGKKKDESYLVSELQKYVTDYMMPTVFVRYREFPYNANGKIDRRFISENINK